MYLYALLSSLPVVAMRLYARPRLRAHARAYTPRVACTQARVFKCALLSTHESTFQPHDRVMCVRRLALTGTKSPRDRSWRVFDIAFWCSTVLTRIRSRACNDAACQQPVRRWRIAHCVCVCVCASRSSQVVCLETEQAPTSDELMTCRLCLQWAAWADDGPTTSRAMHFTVRSPLLVPAQLCR